MLDWDPAPSPKKGSTAPSNFRPMAVLWPNGWMDQDTTWCRSRLQPRPHCVTWGPSSPHLKRGTAPHFSAHVYCGQTAGLIKMPLGTKIGLSQGHIVLHGNPASPPKERGTAQIFWPIFVAKRSPISATTKHLYKWNRSSGRHVFTKKISK